MKKFLSIAFLIINTLAYSQTNDTINFTQEIIKKDISDLLTLKEFKYGTSEEIIERSQPLGYIGENYQRFHIHFISVIKNSEKPLEYFVYGKTKVKNNVSEFQGTIIIEKAIVFNELEFPEIKQGEVIGKYKFFENSEQKGTGVLEGTFKTNFYLLENENLTYNALWFSADGFCNNMFKGTWTSYRTKKVKTCNWGDYRIPDSGKLDIGAGEFGVNPNYLNYGWENYENAYFGNTNNEISKKAFANEKKEWWNEFE